MPDLPEGGAETDGSEKVINQGGNNSSNTTQLTEEQQQVVYQYNTGYYMNNGEFDYMRFYNDMVNAGFSDDIAVFTGSNEILAVWTILRNGGTVDDIFEAYGSGVHEGSSSANGSGGSGAGGEDNYNYGTCQYRQGQRKHTEKCKIP